MCLPIPPPAPWSGADTQGGQEATVVFPSMGNTGHSSPQTPRHGRGPPPQRAARQGPPGAPRVPASFSAWPSFLPLPSPLRPELTTPRAAQAECTRPGPPRRSRRTRPLSRRSSRPLTAASRCSRARTSSSAAASPRTFTSSPRSSDSNVSAGHFKSAPSAAATARSTCE